MAMDKLQAMQLFVRVVDSGSYSDAAAQMGISRALASKLVQGLEESLGVRLLNRTTRRLSLTGTGQTYYRRVSELIARLAEAEAEAAEQQVEPSGRLRVTAPISFSTLQLAPLLAEFQSAHPRIALEMILGDRLVDLVEEGFDLAIRIARLADSSLVARSIAPCRLLCVAAPSYLERRGEPAGPDDLAGHDCLRYSLSARADEWMFRRADALRRVRVGGAISVNNGDFIAALAAAGSGIALLPSFIVADRLRGGSLVRVLRDWESPPIGIHAVYPQTPALPAKTRRLIDFLVERIGPQPIWDRDLP
jgi:DNA-binding transcriptional LysR family regulator